MTANSVGGFAMNLRSGSWVQTNEVRYIYDGMLVIQERDANNLPTVTYTRGRDLSGSLEGAGGIGGLLSRTDLANGQTAYFHADANGNVTAMVNPQQVVVAKYIYDPFGNTLSKAGLLADANTYRFSSKDYHANSGLYYYGYRFYDPNLQRWLNRDPLGDIGFQVVRKHRNSTKQRTFLKYGQFWQGPNLYEFVRNEP